MTVTYETTVLSHESCGEGIVQLTLARPEGYRFAAGQWFRLTIQTADGDDTRTFSHASAPSHPDLDMATRLSVSGYKTALAELRPGDAVHIAGPGGRLRIPDDAVSPIFLTGGVGVTPVRSLLFDAVDRNRRFDDALVLYGNRSADCAPYLEELNRLSDIGVRVVPVYERPPDGWEGDAGFITAQTVVRHAESVADRTFVVTGPPAMVTAMDAVMDELEVEPELRVVERFSG